MKRKLLLILILVLAVTGNAFAIDIDYSGPVDSFTDLPMGETAAELDPGALTGLIQINGSMNSSEYYDYDNQEFIYTLASGAEIHSSVADGMVTTNTVDLTIPELVNATFYRDGLVLENAVGSFSVETPGSYVVDIKDGSNFIQPLKFTIVNSVTGMLNEYVLPNNFSFTDAKRDGAPVQFSRGTVDLSEEGDYRLSYVCNATRVPYYLDIKVDHTPPVLALENVVDGFARGPVSLADSEEHSTIYIEHNGKPMSYRETLNESGSYTVTIKDAAGNSTVYKFVIQFYLNFSSILFILCLLAVIIGIIVYVLKSRNSLRVR